MCKDVKKRKREEEKHVQRHFVAQNAPKVDEPILAGKRN
jgi:hypothetical protein